MALPLSSLSGMHRVRTNAPRRVIRLDTPGPGSLPFPSFEHVKPLGIDPTLGAERLIRDVPSGGQAAEDLRDTVHSLADLHSTTLAAGVPAVDTFDPAHLVNDTWAGSRP